MRKLLLVLLLLLWCLCATAEECVVRILHTSDLHANLTGDLTAPTTFAQLATVLQTLRKDAPGPVLHIDTGDTIEGSLAGAICKGRPILAALHEMGCDFWVPGNHDFDFGTANFMELAAECPVKMLCGNLWPRSATPAKRYTGWTIWQSGPVRIAVIGMTASYLPHWYLDDFSEAFEVESAEAALRRIMPQVHQQGPDAIILAIHQGFTNRQNDPRGVNEVAKLAQLFPEIDLILGGHTHRPVPGRALRRSWYVQPGAHGEFVALAELAIDLENHRVRQITSYLVQPVVETPPDPVVQQMLAPLIAEAAVKESELLHAPLSHEVRASGQPGISCPVSEWICEALAAETHAELALHGTLSPAALPAGRPITGADLFAIIPYENTCITAEVTAAELEEIIAEQWGLRKVYTYCGIWGATATIDADGVAHVTSIGEAQEPPQAEKRYRMVLNSHTAAGGGRTPVLARILAQSEAQTTDTGLSTRDALRNWLLSHPQDFVILPRKWLSTKR